MDTATSLATLYKIIEKLLGPIEAKKSVTAAVSLAISDLQEEFLPITPENLQIRIESYVEDFIDASKDKVA